MQDQLVGQNLIDEALSFTARIEQQQPELYRKEFYYFDTFQVSYALFRGAPDQAKPALERFKQDPVASIDFLLPLLADLRYYDARALAVDLSRAVYTPVATSSKLFGGSEAELGTVIVLDLFEQAYDQLRAGSTVDWETVRKQAAAFGFDNARQGEVVNGLTRQEADSDLAKAFKQDHHAALRQLSWRFITSMAEQRRLSFICAQAIWETVLEFIDGRELPKRQRQQPDSYFAIAPDELDRNAAQRLGGLLSLCQSSAFALVWGMPHVYDFLLAENVISERIYQRAMAAVADIKALLLEHWSTSLWRYSFVHRWGKPQTLTEAEFAAEAAQFAAAIEQSTPLSDDSQESVSFQGGLQQMTEQLLGNFEESVQAESGQEQDQAMPAPAATPPAVAARKPPKPRKSPLQEAKALNKKAKKK